MTGSEIGEGVGRLENRLWWVWLYANILLGLVAASLTLNAIRTIRVEQGINRLQADKDRLLRERAELIARARR